MNKSFDREIFSRGALLYGSNALERLSAAKVSVCGLGAVGGYAVEALARMGVGAFRLFDFDIVEGSNINRQLCALASTCGRKKVDVWRERILDINPDAHVEAFDIFVDSNTVSEVLSGSPDLIVDAVDTVQSKALIIGGAWESGISVVSSMGAARRLDPLKVGVSNIFNTSDCPLAAALRKELRRRKFQGKCMCVYSKEKVLPETHLNIGGENTKKILGSSPIVTGVFGLNLANLALREILEKSR